MDTLATNLEVHTGDCNSDYPGVGCRATGGGFELRRAEGRVFLGYLYISFDI